MLNDEKIQSLSDVKNVKITPWMFGMGKKIVIEAKDGSKIKLKANKFTIGIKGQKRNLKELEKHFYPGAFEG